MKAGGQKRKGNSFENELAKKLSLWVTNGKREDVLERSPASGGKSTVHRKSGKDFGNIAGDLISVSRESQSLIDSFIIEAKHRADININPLIFGQEAKTGFLEWWYYLLSECDTHKKLPMIIVKQNRKPVIICLCETGISKLQCENLVFLSFKQLNIHIILFENFLKNCNPTLLEKEFFV